MSEAATIAVDLDGTLAHYDHWRGVEHIGEPVPRMLERVKSWIAQGYNVVIFTARITPLIPGTEHYVVEDCARDTAISFIKAWLLKHGLPDLEVTNIKRQNFSVFYDDRAIAVVANTGEIVGEHV